MLGGIRKPYVGNQKMVGKNNDKNGFSALYLLYFCF